MNPRILLLPLFALILSSCTPIGLAVTAGTTAGSFAMEDRGFKGATRDLGLKADIVGKWAKSDINFASDLSVIVYEKKAMVMGSVETDDQRAQAISLVWQVEGIEEVYNEILLKTDSSVEDFAHDTWISAKLYTAVTFDAQILAVNYKYDVEGGIVYLIGLAQNKAELERYIAHAKSLSYVRKVVSHVKIKPQKSMFRPNYNKKTETKT